MVPHGNVNGIDFWAETPAGKTGTIVHRRFVKIKSGTQAEIMTENDWLGPAGKKVCEDQRRLVFGMRGDARWIDFDIMLRASQGPVTFGDAKEGAFGLRVADRYGSIPNGADRSSIAGARRTPRPGASGPTGLIIMAR